MSRLRKSNAARRAIVRTDMTRMKVLALECGSIIFVLLLFEKNASKAETKQDGDKARNVVRKFTGLVSEFWGRGCDGAFSRSRKKNKGSFLVRQSRTRQRSGNGHGKGRWRGGMNTAIGLEWGI